eukprot:1005255-Prymnesium_polylepis.1
MEVQSARMFSPVFIAGRVQGSAGRAPEAEGRQEYSGEGARYRSRQSVCGFAPHRAGRVPAPID